MPKAQAPLREILICGATIPITKKEGRNQNPASEKYCGRSRDETGHSGKRLLRWLIGGLVRWLIGRRATALALAGVLALAAVVTGAAAALAFAGILALAIMLAGILGVARRRAGIRVGGVRFGGERARVKTGECSCRNEETSGFIHLIEDFGFCFPIRSC